MKDDPSDNPDNLDAPATSRTPVFDSKVSALAKLTAPPPPPDRPIPENTATDAKTLKNVSHESMGAQQGSVPKTPQKRHKRYFRFKKTKKGNEMVEPLYLANMISNHRLLKARYEFIFKKPKPRWHRYTNAELEKMKMTQAERVILKFGGPGKFIKAMERIDPDGKRGLKVAKSTVYRWLYNKEDGGTGGVIPTPTMQKIKTLARLDGIFLEDSDFLPDKML